MEQQKTKPPIVPGQKIGRWTVLDSFTFSARKEKKWLCRCECGTERYVLERSLRHGGSKSCGCLQRERALEAVTYDLRERVFGDLRVVGRSRKRTQMGTYWTCLCTNCGYTCEVTATELVTGKKTHCGCKTVKNYAYADITNQTFGRLTALYPTKKRASGGAVVWHCRCQCGKELDVSRNDLVYANMLSCGCRKKEHDAELKDLLIHVDGTSIDMLRSNKIPSNNTIGYRGVYLVRGKYMAKIVFKKKQYFLGTYDTVEEAARARKEAEGLLFDGTVQYYEKWKAKADTDAQWAAENPMQIFVANLGEGKLSVSYLPTL